MMQRDEILRKIASFPPLPASAERVIAVYVNPQSEEREWIQEIQKDAEFCSDVIRLANSPAFNFSSPFHSLDELIDRSGKNGLFPLAVVVGSMQWFHTLESKIEIVPMRLWEHNLAVGIGVVELSSILEIAPSPYFFATGFLHDFGKAIMEKTFAIDSREIIHSAEAQGVSVDEAERRLIGIDHMEIGAAILRRWNLPQEMIDAIRWHHLPESYQGDHVLLDLVHVADAIALMMGIGPQSEGLNYQTSPVINERLNLKVAKIEEVILRIQEKIGSLQGPFAPLL